MIPRMMGTKLRLLGQPVYGGGGGGEGGRKEGGQEEKSLQILKASSYTDTAQQE